MCTTKPPTPNSIKPAKQGFRKKPVDLESVVAQWLVHLPLVLEVSGAIPAHGEKKFYDILYF